VNETPFFLKRYETSQINSNRTINLTSVLWRNERARTIQAHYWVYRGSIRAIAINGTRVHAFVNMVQLAPTNALHRPVPHLAAEKPENLEAAQDVYGHCSRG